MTIWKTFKPKESRFESKERYLEYCKNARCGVCHKQLEIGDEFDIRPIQTEREMDGRVSLAVIVHRKCVERDESKEANK